MSGILLRVISGETLVLFLLIQKMYFLIMVLAMVLLHIAFIILSYNSSIPSLFRAFMKGYWILSNFFACIEMWLFFILPICCYIYWLAHVKQTLHPCSLEIVYSFLVAMSL
jgi:hypothetical protein